MWTLALETASAQGSVALLREDTVAACAALTAREIATTLLPTMQRLLEEQGVKLGEIELLVAADGPGSFTGVRIGLTTVKALMEARGLPGLAISTLAAVAEAAKTGPVLAAMDAGRGEVYWGEFPGGGEGIEAADRFGSRLAGWGGAALTPDAALTAVYPQLTAVEPLLAPGVGRLGRRAWRAGGTLPPAEAALRLDARYFGARWSAG